MRQKVLLLSLLAGIFATTSALVASRSFPHSIFIVLPLVCMGICLFFAGYFAGISKKNT